MPQPIDLNFAINLPPEKAIEYFESKGYAISFRWDDMLNEAHAKAFTVAGAMKLDLLSAIRGELDTALKQGKTLQSFRKEMEPILKKHGFWGEVEVTDPQTGEVRKTNVTPWRLRTIYRTNMQSAYMAGRYQAQTEDDNRPYLQYVALMDAKTRDSHAELNGTVLHKDDPWWDTNYPPNGWGCRCRVRARSERDIKRAGLKVLPPGSAKNIAATGFKSNPGKAANFDAADIDPRNWPEQRTWQEYGLQDLREVPADHRQNATLANPGKTVDEAMDIVAKALGISKENKAGFIQSPVEKVAVQYESLRHMVQKRDEQRERFAEFVKKTLEQPYEVWLTRFPSGNQEGYRKQYIGLFEENGKNLLVSVIPASDGRLLYNFMQRNDKSLNSRRRGDALLYKNY